MNQNPNLGDIDSIIAEIRSQVEYRKSRWADSSPALAQSTISRQNLLSAASSFQQTEAAPSVAFSPEQSPAQLLYEVSLLVKEAVHETHIKSRWPAFFYPLLRIPKYKNICRQLADALNKVCAAMLMLHNNGKNVSLLAGQVSTFRNEQLQCRDQVGKLAEHNATLQDNYTQFDSAVQGLTDVHRALQAKFLLFEKKSEDSTLNVLRKIEQNFANKDACARLAKDMEEALHNQRAAQERLSKAEHAISELRQFVKSAEAAKKQVAPPRDNPPDFDQKYRLFEEQYRGTREEIIGRVTGYTAILDNVSKELSLSPEIFPIVDLGCGRGEWLNLLKTNGYKSLTGVDSNAAMTQLLMKRGVDVITDNALTFLEKQVDGAFAAITSFHMVEHISRKELFNFMAEAYRALAYGGVIILETPNPENILVGACDFYTDYTHNKPIPPKLLEFIAVQLGFRRVEILRLHPRAELIDLEDETDAVKRIASYFNSPQDYAVVAYK